MKMDCDISKENDPIAMLSIHANILFIPLSSPNFNAIREYPKVKRNFVPLFYHFTPLSLKAIQKSTEKAITVGVETQKSDFPMQETLDELEQLITTSGAIPVKRFTQKLDHPHPKTYIGKGKLQEIKEYCGTHQIDIAVFDDDLSPAQIKNIETELNNVKVITRTHLILDIFAANAKTAQAKTQVELAQSIFMLPRLTGMWTHLSKQKGGIGMKGPGETEIETDRRALRNRISLLKEKLAQIEKTGFTNENRGKALTE